MRKRISFKSILSTVLSLCILSGQGALVALAVGAPVRKPAAVSLSPASRRAGAMASNTNVMRFLRVEAPQTETLSEGQSATLLPDGRWLLLGGEGESGPQRGAYLKDALTGEVRALPGGLLSGRAWHTATLLPDGAVLVLGGVGVGGTVLDSAELYRPETQQSEPLPAAGLAPRAYHTATLLTEGQVLIAGGTSQDGEPQARVELWNPQTRTAKTVPGRLQSPRSRHVATLQPDGSVLLWGGRSRDGSPLDDGELYEPDRQSLSWIGVFTKFNDENAPYLRASLPKDGATDVPVDSQIALRFSRPLRVNTVTPQTIALRGPDGPIQARLTPAEGGMLAFILPEQKLLEATTYTIALSEATDERGRALGYTMLSFTTEGRRPDSDPAADGELWAPDARNMRGDWRSNRAESPWQKLPPLEAAPGVTALAGQVLLLNGNPLPNVTLQIGARTTVTDRTGRFLLTDLAPGHQVMRLDGQTASRPNKTYGLFKIGVDVEPGKTNVLPFTSWMPRLDTVHATNLSVPTSAEVAVTTPFIPGLEVRVPQGSVVRDVDGRTATQLSITPIPIDRTPFPLPPSVIVPVFFTVQPGAARVIPPRARVIYPNYAGDRPGTRMNFWNYDPEGKGWYVYGQGTVTADGRQVVPDPGVVLYEFTGFMINRNGMPPPPGSGPNPGSDDDGDPVDLSTGLFVYDHTDFILPDTLPVTLTRTYRPQDSASRAFGIGTSHPFDLYLYSAQEYVVADLILPSGGRIHYNRISPGTSYSDAEFEHTSSASVFYKSRLKWNGNGWDLKLNNGITFVFGDEAPLNAIRDRYGNKITISRASTNGFGSPTGPVTRVTSPNGRYINFTNDASNRVTQARDNVGRTVNYTYDTSGRLWKVTDPLGNVTEYGYDTSNRMLTVKDGRAITFLTNQYDANGRVTRQTQADGTTYLFGYTLDTGGKVTQTDITDPRGFVRRLAFNADGQTLTDTFALGKPEQQTVTFERQAVTNLPLSLTDGLGRRTTYLYDAYGNLTDVTRLAGTAQAVTAHFTYEPNFQRLASVTDPLNHTASFTYDSKGSLTRITDPLGHEANFTYNAAGLPLTATDPLLKTTRYDYEGGDLVAITDPLGRVTTRFIDDAGRLLSVTNASGQATRYDYDANNHLTGVIDPLGGAATFTYDANGNLLSVKDARNNVVSYTYDNMDRVATRKDQLLKTESFQYDGIGNVSKATDRRGKVTTYTYDGLNRPSFTGFGTVVPNKGATTYESTTTYTHDAGNRVTKVVDTQTGTVNMSYDGLDHLMSEATPSGSVGYAYDAAGRKSSMMVAGQPAVTYAYDEADRLTGITRGASSVSFAYDAANRTTSTTLPNGVSVEYAYNAASQLTGVTYKRGANALGDLVYQYDAAGRRTKAGGSMATLGLPQTLSGTTYNAANQLTQRGAATLTYDANGNLTGDGTNTYTWNARNQLVSISGAVTASFQYDPFGRRVSKTVGGVTTNYLYDGPNVVQELSGTTPTANLLSGSEDEVFLRTDASGSQSFLLDGLGSTLALTDGAGALQTRYTYDAFGGTTASGGAGSTYQYTGRENDGTGLYYYWARYYSPSMQRFISEDPLDFAGGGFNHYAYVRNDPINAKDPSGQILDTILDVGFVLWDLYNLATGSRKDRMLNGLMLGADLAAVFIPGLTGAGRGVKALSEAEHGADALVHEGRTLRPGPHAGEHIPARGPERDFTAAEREAIDRIGNETGCHTCGSTDPGTKSGHFVPDHQPPNALNPPGGAQDLYPHCLSCSRTQGGEIRAGQQRP
ncbi:MAG: hypothetical protein QOH49_543 [Acidobacteriota bacterium]|jgi:RHS repeat-associated protein|nr:hypothetical protein [Acidobacteriota bacterium]